MYVYDACGRGCTKLRSNVVAPLLEDSPFPRLRVISENATCYEEAKFIY